MSYRGLHEIVALDGYGIHNLSTRRLLCETHNSKHQKANIGEI